MPSAPTPAGLLLPLTTPLESGRFSPAKLRDNIAHYEGLGVDGYLVLGSSAETPLLPATDRREILREARRAIPDGKPLLAGIGRESTRETIEEGRAAVDLGADYLLALTPHYFAQQMTASALRGFYAAVADASSRPVLVYHVPKFTGLTFPAATMLQLAEHGNIAGIKESSGDVDVLRELLARRPPGFRVLCGHAGALVDALRLGADGAVLAAANAIPECYLSIFRSMRAGDEAAAVARHRETAELAALVTTEFGVPGLKAAIDLRGWHGGAPILPLLPAPEEARRRLREALDRLRVAGAIDL